MNPSFETPGERKLRLAMMDGLKRIAPLPFDNIEDEREYWLNRGYELPCRPRPTMLDGEYQEPDIED